MAADGVLSVLSLLRRARTDIWIGGGWGVDALIGEQTRSHRDLDLMHRQEQEATVLAALADAGFVETLDRRPVRFVVTAADKRGTGREIDLHPLVFAEDGSATQASLDPSRPFRYPASAFVKMVAAHAWDLRGAQDLGLRTAYVARPVGDPPALPDRFDLHADGLADLAGQLDRA